MKERTRQRLLRELGWTGFTPYQKNVQRAECLLVYVPQAVQTAEKWSHCATIADCGFLGATNPRVHDGQVVMDWPQKYWD